MSSPSPVSPLPSRKKGKHPSGASRRPGRPYKDPELGPRSALCVRIPEPTQRQLRELAGILGVSQADVVIAAIRRMVGEPPENRG